MMMNTRFLTAGEFNLYLCVSTLFFCRNFWKSFRRKPEAWSEESGDAANEAEEDLEHFMYDQIRIRSKPFGLRELARRFKHEVSSHLLNKLYDFDGIKKATEEIESISREVAERRSLHTTETADTPTVASSLSTLVASDVVGLDDHLSKMKHLLCGESRKLEIIPIVGMGGIGKTTLATTVYRDQLIVESFTVRAWVMVSQDYEAKDIFSRLLELFKEVGNVRSGKSSEAELDRVFKFLKGRKYLIVLDDIWSTNAWDDMKMAFPDDKNGSRIVLTTRIKDVALYTTCYSNYLHQMQFMSSDQSWNLLKQKVFPANKDCPYELECIGKDIARQCGGLPLAIILAAGILSTIDETPLSWLKVAERVRSAGRLENIISLSYTHLPHRLRPCFLYMGCFPKDYEIRVSKLTLLWIAEGFIIEPRDGKSPEEVAEKHLDDLVKRSLALVTKRTSDGKIKSCNVHDMVRDFCKRKAVEENYQLRLSIACHRDPFKDARSTLRSFIWFESSRTALHGREAYKSLRDLRLLRVLDLVSTTPFKKFCENVFFLLHLRYLAITPPLGSPIPAYISRLRSIRTLIFYKHKERFYSGILQRTTPIKLQIPVEILTMPHLTHLISHYPLEFHASQVTMEKLVTLSTATSSICTKNMIQMIPNVKKLGIICFGEEDHQLHNLILLHQLEKLKLVYNYNSKILLNVAVNPSFPDTLKKLTLSGWRFPWKYMEKVGCLTNLQVLKLRDFAFQGDTWETTEEQFPSLEHLYIDGSDLKDWITEDSHFPRLKRVFLFRCKELKKIPDDIGEISTLELIEVDVANQSLVECVERIQEQQHDNGNFDLQVRCICHQEVTGTYERLTRKLKEASRKVFGERTS